MPQAPGNPPPRRSRRSTRGSAPKASVTVNESDEDEFEEDQQSSAFATKIEDLDIQEAKLLEQMEKRKAKQASSRNAAFQTQVKATYAAARKNGKEVSRVGTQYLEETLSKINDFRAQEVPYEKNFKDLMILNKAQDESFVSLLAVYPPMLEDLAGQRSDRINAASEMIMNNPQNRQIALNTFSRNARARYEDVREREKCASDASKLIKHYKNLLYS